MMLFALAALLADGNGAGGGAAGAGAQGGGTMFLVQMGIVLAAAMYFLFYLPSKRERTRQATLLSAIRKTTMW